MIVAACALHTYHRPEPQGLHRHHVVPKAWTERLAYPESVTVLVCATGHDNLHRDLRAAIRGTPWRASVVGRELVKHALAFYLEHPEQWSYLRAMADKLVYG